MSEIDSRSAIDNVEKLGEELIAFLEAESIEIAVIEKLKEDIDGRDVAIMQLNYEMDKLSEELNRQKAIASAELDTIHKLGEDYSRALEEEQKHIREAKVEAVKEIGKKIIDNCHNGVISAVDVLEIVVDYSNICNNADALHTADNCCSEEGQPELADAIHSDNASEFCMCVAIGQAVLR